jgi:hypothetical protein
MYKSFPKQFHIGSSGLCYQLSKIEWINSNPVGAKNVLVSFTEELNVNEDLTSLRIFRARKVRTVFN